MKHRERAALVLLLCLLGTWSGAAQAQGDRYNTTTEAERLLGEGRAALLEARESREPETWRTVVDLMSAALAEDPRLTEAYAHLGYALYALGQHEEAVKRLRVALEMAPEDPELKHVLGLNLFRTGAKEEGAALLESALEEGTPRPDAHFVLGKYHLNGVRYDDARRHFERYLELEPRSTQALQALGVIHYHSQRPEEAKATFSRWVELDPESVSAHTHLGDTFFALEDHAGAIGAYQRAIELAPDQLELQYALASLFVRAERHRDALAAFEAITSERPEHLPGHYFHGESALALGELTMARGDFERVIEIKPDYAYAHLRLAEIARRQQRSQRAVEHIQRAAVLAPEDPEIHALAGSIYREVGEIELAIREHRAAIVLSPQHAPYFELLGEDLLFTRDFEAAVVRYREAVRLDPNASGARAGLSMALLYRGHELLTTKGPKEAKLTAEASFAEALELGVHTLEAGVNLAASALRRGDAERARTLVDHLKQQSPKHPTIQRLERRVLIAERRFKVALTLLPDAAQRTPHDWYDVAVIQAEQRRWELVVEALEEAYKGGVSSAGAFALSLGEYGILLAKQGKHERAERLLARASRDLGGADEGTKLRLAYASGIVALHRGDFQKASQLLDQVEAGRGGLKKWERALLVSPTSALDLEFERAYAHYQNGALDAAGEALASAKKTASVEGLERWLLLKRGTVALVENRPRDAIKALEAIKAPDEVVEHNLAVARYLTGAHKKAARVFQKSGAAEAIYNLSIYYDNVKKDPRAAFESYQRYLSLDGVPAALRGEVLERIKTKQRIFGFEEAP